ncbi:hypothetical protein TSMEX_006010 [Taenia solium]|eukprot:TsM_000789300 transcript=TsM_000789300 gene=TsM_000789300
MPEPQEYMLLIHEERHPHRSRDRRGQRNASARPARASTTSTFKLVTLDESSKHSYRMHKKDADFLLTNGNVYTLNVNPHTRTKLVRLQHIFAPLKPDSPMPKYKTQSRPFAPFSRHYRETLGSPVPVVEIRRSSSSSRISDDDVSSYNGDSDLSTREEAVATKLNDIIQKMETKLYVNGEDEDPYVHNSALENKQDGKKDLPQPTHIKTYIDSAKFQVKALVYAAFTVH